MHNVLVKKSILFADPNYSQVKISPNSQYISYLAPHKGVLNVWLAPSNDLTQAKPISGHDQTVREIWWSPNGQWILYVLDYQGDENWQLHGYHLTQKKTICFTERGLQARIVRMNQSNTIAITLNRRDRRYMDVYRLNLEQNEFECIYENNQYWDFFADQHLNLQYALKIDDQCGHIININNEAETIATLTLHDLFSVYFYQKLRLGLADSLSQLFLVETTQTDTSALVAINLKTKQRQQRGGALEADINDVLVEPRTGQPLAIATQLLRKKWTVLEMGFSVKEDFEYLQNICQGDIDISSQSQDNQIWIVADVRDNGPTIYYRYDRQAKQAQKLFVSLAALEDQPLSSMQGHLVTMRDGVQCPCYLSMPLEAKTPVPLVLMVHGGPNYRDIWGFNPVHQWLSNRGYAVLSVNYRGSTGFGKKHFQLGHGEWAGKMQNDLLDAAQWAVQQKITTQDQIAIMGRSYGGYAVLVGLSMTPEQFCCGVELVGPSNLTTMLKHFPPYWQAMQGAIHEMVGCDPRTPEGQAYLKERSPLFYAHQITKPLLIGHGANDVRVMQAESDQMVEALKQNNIPVTYAVFTDEGHQMLHPANRMAFYQLAEAFLARIFHGKVSADSEQLQTSMQIKIDTLNLMRN